MDGARKERGWAGRKREEGGKEERCVWKEKELQNYVKKCLHNISGQWEKISVLAPKSEGTQKCLCSLVEEGVAKMQL